jgi:predicted Abi (CAAX) family protease
MVDTPFTVSAHLFAGFLIDTLATVSTMTSGEGDSTELLYLSEKNLTNIVKKCLSVLCFLCKKSTDPENHFNQLF